MYPNKPGSQEEEELPIAYSILMHKDPVQVERLLRSIYQPQNMYCIHVDAAAIDTVHKAMEGLTQCFDNVFIASKLETVVYAGISRLQADINCMNDLLKRHWKWQYFINLVGQVFPLKTNRELVTILKVYHGMNDIEGLPLWRRIKVRYQNVWLEQTAFKRKMVKLNATNPDPPHNLTIVRGSAYGVFSRAFVSYISNNEIAKDFLKWSHKTWSPDEHYWATLNHLFYNPHLKTPGGYTGLPDRKPWLAVYASWKPINPCYGKHVRGVCIFGIGDLPQLISRKELFSNKFYIDYEYLTLDCLEEWLRNKTLYPLSVNTYYYRQLPFVAGS